MTQSLSSSEPAVKHTLMLVTNDFEPDQRVRKEAQSLLRFGMHVSVICLNRLPQYSAASRSVEGIAVHSVSSGPLSPGRLWSLGKSLVVFYIKSLCVARLIDKRRRVHVIHCHDLDTLVLGWLLKTMFRVPLIYDMHDWYPSYFHSKMARRMMSAIDSWFCQTAEGLIVVNDHFQNAIRRKRDDVKVIMNTPVLEGHGPVAATGVGLFYSGNLDSLRDMRYAMDTFRECGLPVELVGDGPLYSDYRTMSLDSRIRVPGRVSAEAVVELTKDCFAVLALYDTSHPNNRLATPNKVFEAMKFGKPSLVSGGTVMADIVESEGCGIAVEYGNAESLRAAIEMLKLPDVYRKMSQNGCTAFLRSYNWQAMESRLWTLYEDLL